MIDPRLAPLLQLARERPHPYYSAAALRLARQCGDGEAEERAIGLGADRYRPEPNVYARTGEGCEWQVSNRADPRPPHGLEKEQMDDKARWHQNSPTSWILKMPHKYGSAVLATVVRRSATDYAYTTHTIPIQIGAELSARAAKSAARRALREVNT